jgi:hypothetical protein
MKIIYLTNHIIYFKPFFFGYEYYLFLFSSNCTLEQRAYMTFIKLSRAMHGLATSIELMTMLQVSFWDPFSSL